MKNIVFIAPHGAGKGTQCSKLKDKYNFNHLSTGDLIRDAIKKDDDFGKSLKKTIDSGKLVSDDIVLEMIKNYIKNCNQSNGIIFDGYPRTVSQAKTLYNFMNELNEKIDVVFYLKLSKEEAFKRTIGRLICPNCKKSYNKYYEDLKPKKENICDVCNTKLESRSDDTEEVFNKLFDVFLNDTYPLLDYYQQQGILITIDASLNQDDIFKEIEKVI